MARSQPWRTLCLLALACAVLASGAAQATLLPPALPTTAETAPAPLALDFQPTPLAPPPVMRLHGWSGEMDQHHTLEFVCPTFGPEHISTQGDAHYVVPGCPIRIYDIPYSFGSTEIVVHPDDHRQVAFFSLHGYHSDNGPTERSRTDRPHTTFTSPNQGLNWEDQPDTSGTYGESATGTMDSQGRLYIGYHYSMHVRDGSESQLYLYRAGSVLERDAVFQSYRDPYIINAITDAGWFTRAHLVRVDGVSHDGREEAVVNETRTAAEIRDEHVALVWHERAGNPEYAPNGWSGWINAAWAKPAHAGWNRLRDDARIGPCSGMSNPVSYDGHVYVACTVAAGYDARRHARIGEIDMWRLDLLDASGPVGGNATLLGWTGLVDGQTNLAATPDGYMVLTAGNVTAEGHYSAHFAVGWYGEQWNAFNFFDLGRLLDQVAGAGTIRDAHITALVVSQETRTGLLVYKEWREPEVADTPLPDLPTLPVEPAAYGDYNKILMSFNACDGPLAASALTLGTGLASHHVGEYATNPGGFNDLKDGLTIVREANGREIAYFAVNDYGSVQYGGITFGGTFCPQFPLPPPPIIPGIPLPQALTLANPGLQYVGAGIGAVSLAMITYLLALRRRATNPLATEDR